jgi:hypothetical protein
MPISFPSNTKDVIDDIRDAIGRIITFVTEIEADCPACGIDPFTNTSTNPFCTTCSGLGYLVTYSGDSVMAHITWGGNDQLGWATGGQMMEGDCRVQVELTSTILSTISGATYVEVDGHRMGIRKNILRGVQPLNRVLLDLSEEE